MEKKYNILIYTYFRKNDYDLTEFKLLSKSFDKNILNIFIVKLKKLNLKYFIGKGKVNEILENIKNNNISYIIFNNLLTSSQKRNLENIYKCNVIDKIELILNIFSKRAKSYEGKLQVKLAELKYFSTRLVKGWSHLERQKGGIGFHGPGEKQLETDRRILKNKIIKINSNILNLKKQREENRKCRIKSKIPIISIIGYTNSGKSTLFNLISSNNSYVSDKLFSTLDPKLKKVNIKNIKKFILTDTVGFIRDLPHNLIESFKSTLSEIRTSSLLLHMVDYTKKNFKEDIYIVNNILKSIKANKIKNLIIMNKIDLLNNFTPKIELDKYNLPKKVWISSKTKIGFKLLLESIKKILEHSNVDNIIKLPINKIKIFNTINNLNIIINKYLKDNNIIIKISTSRKEFNKLLKIIPELHKYIIK